MSITQHTAEPGVVPFPLDREAAYLDRGAWQALTIAEQFRRIAGAHPDRPAVLFGDSSYTFAELDAESDSIAAGLSELGLRPGGAVLLQVRNSASAVAAWYSLLKAGLRPVCTLPLHRRNELAGIIDRTRPVAHLVDADNLGFDLVAFARELAEDDGSPRVVLTLTDDDRGVNLMRLGQGIDASAARQTVDDIQSGLDTNGIAVFQLSGGTTGIPKVIPCLHAAYWSYATHFATAMQWSSDDRVAYFGPFVHNAGTVIGLHGPHSVGACAVLGTPGADELFTVIARHDPTSLPLGPFAYDAVLDPRMYAAPSLRRVLFWGRQVPRAHFEALESHAVWGGQVFGMSEGLCMTTPIDYSFEARLRGIGVPIAPDDEVRLLAAGTEDEVPDGEIGEMAARGPYTTCGYFDADDYNGAAYTSDGFYRSGDLMRRQIVDGVPVYSIEGRIKDLISRGGEKISTAEVEMLVVLHSGISEAAIVAMPDDRLGERACAFVIGPGEPVTLAELRDHLATLGVAKYKWPERVVWLAELPRASEVGKIDRLALRDLAAELRAEIGLNRRA
jgi:2,3-dihydroxybenzoate-AMP ligase